MNLLENKNIVIMGLRNRWSIAWGIAKSFKDAGANLILSYQGEREEKNARNLSAQLGDASIFPCDVSNDHEIENFYNFLKDKNIKISGLAHCIAHARKEEMTNDFIYTTRDGFSHALDVSVYSLIVTSRVLLPLMEEGASILTLSYMGAEKVFPGYNVMGVAKAALEASVRYMAYNLGDKKIRVNAISSGPIKTISAGGIKDFTSLLDASKLKSPIQEELVPDNIGQVALFLMSPLSGSITGEVIHVDNGFNIMGV